MKKVFDILTKPHRGLRKSAAVVQKVTAVQEKSDPVFTWNDADLPRTDVVVIRVEVATFLALADMAAKRAQALIILQVCAR